MEKTMEMRKEACPAMLYLMRQKNKHLMKTDMNADERLEEFYYFSLFLENFAAERILSENNNFTSTKQNNSKAIIFFRNMIAAEKKSAEAEKLEDGSSSSDGVEGPSAPITGSSKKLRTR